MLRRRLRALRGLARLGLKKASGLDAERLLATLEDVRRRLEVLAERVDALDARSLAANRKLGLSMDEPPPASLVSLVGGNYHTAGAAMFGNLLGLAGLRKDERVLDVGCGVGRTAVHLAKYLSAEGSYRGFDIVGDSIRWCRTHLTPVYLNFEFTHADVFNGLYNPAGTLKSAEFSFPYPAGSFDVVFLDSVFTHMEPADVAHYLSEIHRVLVPGGRCLATFFVLDAQARRTMSTSPHRLDFAFAGPGYWTVAPDCPESAIAFERASVLELFRAASLEVREPIVLGSWSARPDVRPDVQQQDLVLATK